MEPNSDPNVVNGSTQEAPIQSPPKPAPPFPEPVSSGGISKKLIVLIIAIIVVAGLVFWGLNRFVLGPAPQSGDILATGSPSSSGSAGSCRSLDKNSFDLMVSQLKLEQPGIQWTATDKYPEEFPDDFPKYKNAQAQAYVAIDKSATSDIPALKLFIVISCSPDDSDKVREYFRGLTFASTGWESQYEAAERQYANSPGLPPEVKQSILQSIKNQALMTFVRGGVPATGKPRPQDIMSVAVSQNSIGYSFSVLAGTQ